MPPKYWYIESFYPPEERNGNIQSFKQRIWELIIGDKISELSVFLEMKRGPEENIMLYFYRLRDILIYVSGETDESFDKSSWIIKLMFLKLTSTSGFSAIKLKRLMTNDIENETATLTQLGKAVFSIDQKDRENTALNRVSDEIKTYINCNENIKMSDGSRNRFNNNHSSGYKLKKCNQCGELTHIKKNCYLNQVLLR